MAAHAVHCPGANPLKLVQTFDRDALQMAAKQLVSQVVDLPLEVINRRDNTVATTLKVRAPPRKPPLPQNRRPAPVPPVRGAERCSDQEQNDPDDVFHA